MAHFKHQPTLPTDVFDAAWYERRYPDVALTGLSPLQHYLYVGACWERDPSPQLPPAHYRKQARQLIQSGYFDTEWYAQQYPDVQHAGADPAIHYLRVGVFLQRDPNPFFSAAYYLNQVGHDQRAKRNPLAHYLQHGLRNGLQPHAAFAAQWYLQTNPDVAKAGLEPLRHYLRYGKLEGRAPSPHDRRTKKIGFIHQINSTRKAILRFTSLGIRVIRSGVFDGAWYLRQNPNLAGTKWPAIYHYVKRGCVEDASRDFCAQEYLHMNPDVARARIPAILHYERYGKATGRLTSLLETGREPPFPPDAVEYTSVFDSAPAQHRRAAVFASYSSDGTIQPYVLHYLKGLREVCDNIVFVTDCPLHRQEENKLQGLVSCMIVSRHGEYDFGSYKRGWDWLQANDGLRDADELIFCNDSCCAPFNPFTAVFSSMQNRRCDFWGLSVYQIRDKANKTLKWHFQSFFLVFRPNVFRSHLFNSFMNSIRKLPEPTRENVVEHYEFSITDILANGGFSWDSYIPPQFYLRHKVPPTYLGATLMARHGMPLLKVKSFGDNIHAESPRKVLRTAKRLNPELYEAFIPYFTARRKAAKQNAATYSPPRIDLSLHQASFAAKVTRVRQRIFEGKPARVTFLVGSTSMFPSLPLLHAMQHDPAFAPKIVVIPGANLVMQSIEHRINELRTLLPSAEILSSETGDSVSPWLDVSLDSDLVIYNSPYSASHFFYQPRFSYGRDFLPIHVNYGYYRSVYDRHVMGMDNYAYFWKALFENRDIVEEYKKHSIIGGTNALLTGYIKMDALATKSRRGSKDRRCVLIAPHHSVEGGANDVLQLANFTQYASLFLSLPPRYPDIDFVFRPHPALFNMLSRADHWGSERVSAWRKEFTGHHNVRWSDGPDYLQDFADSDGIIQDCGSFLVEYFYTGKPCCYMLKTRADIHQKFTPFGRDCLDHCYLAYAEPDITQFINQVIIEGKDPLSERRERFRRETVMMHYPEASAVALSNIKRDLGVAV
jgi:hypothetical protein